MRPARVVPYKESKGPLFGVEKFVSVPRFRYRDEADSHQISRYPNHRRTPATRLPQLPAILYARDMEGDRDLQIMSEGVVHPVGVRALTEVFRTATSLETYDVGMTIDLCGRRHQEASVAEMSIAVETEVLIDITVADGVDHGLRTEATTDIGAEALEAAIWTMKRICQCRGETRGTSLRCK